jgi:hypothetical protein
MGEAEDTTWEEIHTVQQYKFSEFELLPPKVSLLRIPFQNYNRVF